MTAMLASELATDAITRTSTGEAVTFWVLGALALVGAVGMVLAANAVYSAMFLAMTMIILAVFYMVQDALFLGVVQVVVYTGAVMMLFLFVLMLIGVDTAESLVETLRGQRIAAAVAGVGFGILLIAGIGAATTTTFVGLSKANAAGNVNGLASLIFTRYLWAFELTSALLITAAVGAMVLTHKERFERRKTQRELAIERFRSGRYPTPCPGRGCMPATTRWTSRRGCPTGRPRNCLCRRYCGSARSVTVPTWTVRHEPTELPLSVGAAIHDRRGRSAFAAQCDCDVHVC
ncbi:NADH-ubiquinone/plastoquinone oxidoreductase chain 6 family protein [Mycobacterium xenopi 3993]|nr:NADH-ubiquinone/plastoquinone oxidoreductase chain 6 family protein [Mycobacterium xenopi 3993]